MVTSNIQATIPAALPRVWSVVTDVHNYGWRSDLAKTEVLSEEQFVEYTQAGYATSFTVTGVMPCSRWELRMENSNLYGHWVGIFKACDGGTRVDFTETVTVKNKLFTPFIKPYLKRQQARFIADLKQAVQQ